MTTSTQALADRRPQPSEIGRAAATVARFRHWRWLAAGLVVAFSVPVALLGLSLAALGGSMVLLEVFPETMKTVAKITPHAWANEAFAELLLDDGALADVLPQLGVLLAFAVSLLALATWRLRSALT
jgi:ABC-type uncharacterized transport system permease subunit